MDMQKILDDLAELKQLDETAVRENTKKLFRAEIHRLERAISAAKAGSVQSGKTSAASSTVLPVSKILNYAWDQSEKFLKLYITLPNVQNADSDQITTTFQPNGVRMVAFVDGKKSQLEITNLLHEIDTEKSYHKLKTDMVAILLKKKAEGQTWDSVTLQDKISRDKKLPKFDEKGDPQEGLMQMMRQMYEDGDDEMKRTIKKAMYESNQKRMGGGDPSAMDV